MMSSHLDDVEDVLDAMETEENDEDDDEKPKQTGIMSEIKDDHIVFSLNQSETIFSTVNPMYVKGTVNLLQISQPNVVKSIEYTATSPNASIAFGSSYQNSILKKHIQSKTVYISKYNILAFTNNVSLENEHIARCENGLICLSAYGSYEELDVKPGDLVNSGIYLMSDIKPIDKGNGNYSFEAPTRIMIQTKNVKNLFKSANVPTATTVPTVTATAVPTAATTVTAVPVATVATPSSAQPKKSGWFSGLFGMKGGGPESTEGGAVKDEINMRNLLRSI